MAIRSFRKVEYLPFLSLRPAEMRALETLPEKTKDALLPVIPIRPWLGAYQLSSALDRIKAAYGTRPFVAHLAAAEPTDTRRPVHDELDELREPDDGFANWCELIEAEGHENFIPSLQFGTPAQQQDAQLERLFALNRGLFVIIERPAFQFIDAIAQRVGSLTQSGRDVCFVLDYGRARRDHLQVAAETVVRLNAILEHAPNAYLSVSASSFPDGFDGLVEQEIYERRLFQEVAPRFDRHMLMYSDRGSARAENQNGGGGRPPPRIDYPMPEIWKFYRSTTATGAMGYQQQAQALLNTNGVVWNPNLRVWGTQMIERTAIGDSSAITNPQRATAARINIHLQRQTYYNQPDEAEDTDEDWDD